MKVFNLDTGRLYALPVKVNIKADSPYGDWSATCSCGGQCACGSWRDALVWTCGHLAVDHQGDPR